MWLLWLVMRNILEYLNKCKDDKKNFLKEEKICYWFKYSFTYGSKIFLKSPYFWWKQKTHLSTSIFLQPHLVIWLHYPCSHGLHLYFSLISKKIGGYLLQLSLLMYCLLPSVFILPRNMHPLSVSKQLISRKKNKTMIFRFLNKYNFTSRKK